MPLELGDVDADVHAEPVDKVDVLTNALADEQDEGAADVLGRDDILLQRVERRLADAEVLEVTVRVT